MQYTPDSDGMVSFVFRMADGETMTMRTNALDGVPFVPGVAIEIPDERLAERVAQLEQQFGKLERLCPSPTA